MNLGVRRPQVFYQFPTTPILDDFNRANTGPPPSANWTTGILLAVGMKVVSNALVGDGASGDGYWSAASFGPNTEAYSTWTTTGTASEHYWRIAQPGAGTVDGYKAHWFRGACQVNISRLDNGVATQIGGTIQLPGIGISSGDAVGISMIGSVVTGYYKPSGSAWTGASSTRSDSTYTAAGFNGILCGNAETWDDFGGGTAAY